MWRDLLLIYVVSVLLLAGISLFGSMLIGDLENCLQRIVGEECTFMFLDHVRATLMDARL